MILTKFCEICMEITLLHFWNVIFTELIHLKGFLKAYLKIIQWYCCKISMKLRNQRLRSISKVTSAQWLTKLTVHRIHFRYAWSSPYIILFQRVSMGCFTSVLGNMKFHAYIMRGRFLLDLYKRMLLAEVAENPMSYIFWGIRGEWLLQ